MRNDMPLGFPFYLERSKGEVSRSSSVEQRDGGRSIVREWWRVGTHGRWHARGCGSTRSRATRSPAWADVHTHIYSGGARVQSVELSNVRSRGTYGVVVEVLDAQPIERVHESAALYRRGDVVSGRAVGG